MDDLGRDAEGRGDGRVYRLPGQGLVARDLHGLADGGGIAQEADEAHREVAGMRQRPERLAVAVDDDPPPVQHALGAR